MQCVIETELDALPSESGSSYSGAVEWSQACAGAGPCVRVSCLLALRERRAPDTEGAGAKSARAEGDLWHPTTASPETSAQRRPYIQTTLGSEHREGTGMPT